ncbi:2-phospho-L-lactate guanylyltransferase [Natronomonas sp.]|uniref:2-phospho-L-lactate guanylyltransferase n=1 Tax=Natronomonas sp. TaxID=2184060 RepID=UPI00261E369E|nr:2-phospho-L-lactate guanylyltransferase [Natronomonas sp.]
MSLDVLVPFAATEPKTRLEGVFGPEERAEFARAMLRDVCAAIAAAGGSPTVLSTAEVESRWPVVVDERPLTAAVNARLEPPMAVVMSDLALATPEALSRLFDADGAVVVAPGLGGGTNALVVRHPEFYTDYHGASIEDHRRIAEEIGADPTVVDSFRLAVDVDEPDDLVELTLHGEGAAAAWLEGAAVGVDPDRGEKRVGLDRDRS